MERSVVYSYSSLLFEIGLKEKKIHKFFSQARSLINTLEKTNLESFLANLSIPKDIRKKNFFKMFKNKLETKFIYFVWTMIDYNRARLLEKILRSFLIIYDDYFGIAFVKVTSPYELTEKQMNSIKRALVDKFNKKVSLENVVDPSVIGGIKIESKSLTIDNTFKRKLDIIKRRSISMTLEQ